MLNDECGATEVIERGRTSNQQRNDSTDDNSDDCAESNAGPRGGGWRSWRGRAGHGGRLPGGLPGRLPGRRCRPEGGRAERDLLHGNACIEPQTLNNP